MVEYLKGRTRTQGPLQKEDILFFRSFQGNSLCLATKVPLDEHNVDTGGSVPLPKQPPAHLRNALRV